MPRLGYFFWFFKNNFGTFRLTFWFCWAYLLFPVWSTLHNLSIVIFEFSFTFTFCWNRLTRPVLFFWFFKYHFWNFRFAFWYCSAYLIRQVKIHGYTIKGLRGKGPPHNIFPYFSPSYIIPLTISPPYTNFLQLSLSAMFEFTHCCFQTLIPPWAYWVLMHYQYGNGGAEDGASSGLRLRYIVRPLSAPDRNLGNRLPFTCS